MFISVVIPAFNAAATIADCLQAVQNQTIPPDQYEIIVVDDGSWDDTAVLVSQLCPKAQLLRCAINRGAAAARNQGILAAQGELVCFTDADCTPTPTWLAELTRPFQQTAVDACKGVYATHQPQLVARFVQLEYEDKYDRMARLPQIDFVDTYAAAYRRQLLIDNGGFNEKIFYVEDQELSFRLAAQNRLMLFTPTAVVYHHHSHTLLRYMRKKFWIGCWKARFIGQYPDRVINDSHTPQILKVQMGLAALLLLLLPLGWLFWPFMLAFAASLSLFALTTAPFCAKAWAKDKAVAVVSPFLLLVRALALGLGFVWGTLSRPSSLV